jgi:hypothetical protein
MQNVNVKSNVQLVIGDLNSKKETLNNLVKEIETTETYVVDYCRKVLFSNYYNTNPLFLKDISEEDKEEIRNFLFSNYYEQN